MQNKSTYSIAIALIIGFGLGLLFGQLNGQKMGVTQAEIKYKPLVDSAFPPPPAFINSVSGTVKNVYGATVTLEINDPEDYLPHIDGTPAKKLSVTADVYSGTKINSIDYSKTDKDGNPKVEAIELGDFKIGSSVRVISSTNIRGADKFDAAEIDLILK